MTSQENITAVVRNYIKRYPREYSLFKGQNIKRSHSQKNKFASVGKGQGALERKITEVPETLFTMMTVNLPLEDMEYYKSKNGTRWFAGQFPEFRIAGRI